MGPAGLHGFAEVGGVESVECRRIGSRDAENIVGVYRFGLEALD